MRRSLLWFGFLAASAIRAEIVDLREGTNLTLAIHPDGEYMVVDLLGGLWRLPVTGGGATALVPAGSGIAQPRFDPSGDYIVFQQWVDGQWDISRFSIETSLIEHLAASEFNEREPEFSADGQEVVFVADYSARYSLWSLNLETRALRQLTDEPGDARFPTFDETGALAYVDVLSDRSEVKVYEDRPRGRTLFASEHRLDAPSWRPGGGVLVVNERIEGQTSDLTLYIDADDPIWRPLTTAEDVFVGRAAWLSPEQYVYAADGALWRRGIGSPERNRILLIAAVDVAEPVTEPVPRRSAVAGSWPISGINGLVHHGPTGRSAFTALGDLWLFGDDQIVRLTDDGFTDVSPQFTADGLWLVFASDRSGKMEIWRRKIDSELVLQVSDEPGDTFEPRVSPDGQFVAFLETSDPDRADGIHGFSLKLIALDRPFASETLATGLVTASNLNWQGRFLRLTARDEPAGDPYRHVFATAAEDAFGPPATGSVELPGLIGRPDLYWEPAAASAPFVIRAGRFFDGLGSEYRNDVDIHIEGQRVTNIVGRDDLPLPERVVDVRDSTVVPGLVDVHTHLDEVSGSATGRRLLGYGITTIGDVTADWNGALELAETWASGQQPGPRVVVMPPASVTGFAIPDESPIVLGSGRRILGGLGHALDDQWSRDGNIRSDFAPAFRDMRAAAPPRIALSTLGRSYGDVFGQIRASGVYLATTLGALRTSRESARIPEVTDVFDRVLRSSGSIAVGSDAPAVAWGSGFHDELGLLAARGMPEDQILRYATAGGAIALGLSFEIGTLEPGRLADLVVVNGDPLNDIGDLRRIEAVVKDGVWHDIVSNELAR